MIHMRYVYIYIYNASFFPTLIRQNSFPSQKSVSSRSVDPPRPFYPKMLATELSLCRGKARWSPLVTRGKQLKFRW